jgi:hypothetical protein
MYALVENGVISLVKDLPENWQNISHLPGLSATELKEFGWYECIVQDYPTYDPTTQTVDQGASYIPNTSVTVSYTVRDVTPEELAAIQAQAAAKAAQDAAIAKAALIEQAQSLLDKSDITILRCVSAQVTVPAEWQTYRVALRSIVSSGAGTIPTRPNYPVGT